MTIKKIFFDANIFNDIFDKNRSAYPQSYQAYIGSLGKGIEVCTSCDIATNIYYITAKYTSKSNALDALDLLKKSVTIIPFGVEELTQTIALMREDEAYKDFEDSIQYILALNTQCDVIVSNDRGFVAKGLPCMSSEVFVREYLG